MCSTSVYGGGWEPQVGKTKRKLTTSCNIGVRNVISCNCDLYNLDICDIEGEIARDHSDENL